MWRQEVLRSPINRSVRGGIEVSVSQSRVSRQGTVQPSFFVTLPPSGFTLPLAAELADIMESTNNVNLFSNQFAGNTCQLS